MPPPSDITEFQAAWRVGGSILVCGGTLPLCHALFSLSRPGTVAFSLTLGVAIAALAYLGALRASITHQVNDAAPNPPFAAPSHPPSPAAAQDKRRLALQTVALVIPCLVLPQLFGMHLTPPTQ